MALKKKKKKTSSLKKRVFLKLKKKPLKKKVVKKKKVLSFKKRTSLKLKKKPLKKKPLKKKAISKKKLSKKIKEIRKAKIFSLEKLKENPIISPRGENIWESWQTFNPGVIFLNEKVHFLYRAIGQDGISRMGYAMSKDGFNIDERLPHPVFEHYIKNFISVFNTSSYFSGGSWAGCEDSRLVRIEDEDIIYMTYTAVGDGGLRVALTSININDFLEKKWKWKEPILISFPNQVHKNWVIFPEKINGKYAILHSLNPEIQIAYLDDLNFDNSKYIESFYAGKTNEGCWDRLIKGAGAPPIKTEEGWLLFYHALDANDWGKYKVGAMLLDIENPAKILFRSKTPILEPAEFYESNGYKSGIVYASGAVVKNGTLFLYYGGADSYVCVASADLKEFLKSLINQVKPKLIKQKIKNKK